MKVTTKCPDFVFCMRRSWSLVSMLRTCGQRAVCIQVSRLTIELFVFLAIFFIAACLEQLNYKGQVWTLWLKENVLWATNGCVIQRTVVGYSEAKTKGGQDADCCKFFGITLMGKAAVKSHVKGAKHVEVVKPTTNVQASLWLWEIWLISLEEPLKTVEKYPWKLDFWDF